MSDMDSGSKNVYGGAWLVRETSLGWALLAHAAIRTSSQISLALGFTCLSMTGMGIVRPLWFWSEEFLVRVAREKEKGRGTLTPALMSPLISGWSGVMALFWCCLNSVRTEPAKCFPFNQVPIKLAIKTKPQSLR